MNIHNIPEDQIFNAYKKLKHYFFYDNTTLFVREKIAIFENEIFSEGMQIQQIKGKLKNRMIECVNSILKNNEYLDGSVGVHVLPKQIKNTKSDIVTNNSKDFNEIVVERYNLYIDAPIELHIISVLWVMFAGRYLNPQIDCFNYANKLNLDINEENELPQENLKLFKPYFVQYQQWRDDAIKKAESLLDEKRNVTILSLDIKEYFHSIRLNFDVVQQELKREIESFYTHKKKPLEIVPLETGKFLTQVLSKIHERYFFKLNLYHKINDTQKIEEDGCYPLPIGLISSGFLGNYYLKDLDKAIIENINPAYYGRYVDDLMFVFSDLQNHVKPELISPTVSFIYENFVKKEVLDIGAENELAKTVFLKENKGDKITYIDNFECSEIKKIKFEDLTAIGYDEKELINKLISSIKFKVRTRQSISCGESIGQEGSKNYDLLTIQAKKIVLHYFNWRESRAVLNIFKKRLEKQRSEFRFLPDEDEISDEFDEEAFSLKYNDSENKFRSIEDFSENKYGASKFLAKKIFAISFGDQEDDTVTDKQILTFFKESTALNFYSMWEKVATYFVLQGRNDHLIKFKRNVESAIAKIKENPENLMLTETIKKSLTSFLNVSITISLTLDPKLTFEFLNSQEKNWLLDTQNSVTIIRKSNLFRTSLLKVPCINFTNYILSKESLIDNDYNNYFKSIANKAIVDYLAFLAPSYIPFHEVNTLKIINTVSHLDEKNLSETTEKKFDPINSIPDLSFDDYYKINYSWKNSYTDPSKKGRLKNKYFSLVPNSDQLGRVQYFEVDVIGEKDEDFANDKIDKRIALANLKVDNKNVDKSINGEPNLTRARRKTVFKLLNEADRLESDIIIFPEVSVPYSWLRLLAERSHKRYMGIVAGLEHWINNKGVAFNFMATILPFKVHDYKTSLIKIRLKNHYSHSEKELLRGYRLLVPEDLSAQKNASYDLFHWKKTYFSVYNCFELANIYHRSLFKSKVDFIVASEYNRDTSYFSDIAGAWVRDVHTYFIQVNSSEFGDSRLIQPAKSFSKDLIQVKGGENSTILVGSLEIEKLRKFQLVEYHLQKQLIDSGKFDFKPTPPDFDRDNVKVRIKNTPILPKQGESGTNT